MVSITEDSNKIMSAVNSMQSERSQNFCRNKGLNGKLALNM